MIQGWGVGEGVGGILQEAKKKRKREGEDRRLR